MAARSSAQVADLRCEYSVNPVGVENQQLRVSWMLTDTKRGAGQTAYRVLVSSSEEHLRTDVGDVWDSGRVESNATTDVALEIKSLQPDATYHWKVQIWDQVGQIAPWSAPAKFSTGLLSDADWKGAQWVAWRPQDRYQKDWLERKAEEKINPDGSTPLGQGYAFWPGNRKPIWEIYGFNKLPYDPAPLLRREFPVEKTVRRAVAYICGIGYHELFLNGKRVGNHVLDPGWTDFSKRALYVAHDVTTLITKGNNALGVMLGRGWYSPIANDINSMELSWWRGQPKLLFNLSLEYDDGTRQNVISDNNWKVTGGPVLYDTPRHGEIYDARMEKPGWATPGYADESWEKVAPAPAPTTVLRAQTAPPIREIRTVKPTRMFKLETGESVFEFPEVLAGWPRVKLRGAAGTKVQIVMAEDPDPANYIDAPPNHGAAGIQQFGHILKGSAEETATMRFSYKSFQFVRISADAGLTPPKLDDVEAVVVHSDVESVSEFKSSDPLLNRIHENIRRTFLANYHSVQTDNPHREKYGWLGDAMVTAPSALANFDMVMFYDKYMRDVADTRQPDGNIAALAPPPPWPGNITLPYAFGLSPVWSSAFWSIAWEVYQQTGDARLIREHYETIKGFLAAVEKRSTMPNKPDIINETHADWNQPGVVGGRPPEGGSVYGTAYYYQGHRTVAKMARVLAKNDDVKAFDAAADRIRNAFHREFFDAATNTYHGEIPTPFKQSISAIALNFQLVPQERQSAVLHKLVEDIRVTKRGHLNTGLLGTQALFEILPQLGEAETALLMLQKKTFPGLGFMVESRNATTVWEQWVRDTSLNQPAFGSPDSFFIRHLAGMKTHDNHPGFAKAVIKPQPVGDLEWVEGSFRSVRGTFKNAWRRKDGSFSMEVTVPPNTTAEVWVPAGSIEQVTEGKKPVTESVGIKFKEMREGYAVFDAASGIYSFLSSGGLATASRSPAGAVKAKPDSLRCEYLLNPIVVDVERPRFSWTLESSGRGASQTAYQILVSSSAEKLSRGEGDVWDSGKVASENTSQIEYNGTPLISDRRYFWSVRLWDSADRVGAELKEGAWFGTGLLTKDDWKNAEWIAWKPQDVWKTEWDARKAKEYAAPGPGNGFPFKTQTRIPIWSLLAFHEIPYDAAPLLRKEFAVSKKLKRATAYISGLGYYELSANGKKISDHVLDPAMTDFQRRVFYVAHDVTQELRMGQNTLGVMLGRGFYGHLSNDAWNFDKALTLGQPKMILRLSLLFEDGQTQDVVSDLSWKVAGGPIIYDCPRRGEIYDAQAEKPGWDKPGFNDTTWASAAPAPSHDGKLSAQMLPPIRQTRIISPVKISEPQPGVFVYDLGENIAGWARIKLRGPKGTRVLLRYTEKDNDPEFFSANIGMFQEDAFILGGAEQTFEARFTYKGFRYIRVTGSPSLSLEDLKGVAVHSDLADAGEIVTSNPLVNQIQDAVRRTLLNNAHGFPEDCPTREKMGWMQDGYAGAQAAVWNFDMAAFYTKWIQDMADGQHPNGQMSNIAPTIKTAGTPFTSYGQGSSPIWSAAFPEMVWKMYEQYGDRRVLETNYDALRRLAEAIKATNTLPGKEFIVGDAHSDWIPPDSTGTRPPEDPSVYATAVYFHVVDILARISKVIGKNDSSEMRIWADKIAAAYNSEFLDKTKNLYFVRSEVNYRQSANALPLAYGIVPPDKQQTIAGNLLADIGRRGDLLNTGIVGTGPMMELLPTLGDGGVQAMWKLLTRTDFPSWGHMLKDGNGTIWERWQGDSSLNHPAFGAVGGTFFRQLAGIQPSTEAPGFAAFSIRSVFPEGLNYVKASHETIRGKIRSEWKRTNDQLELAVEIPYGTHASVCVPTADPNSVTEGGLRTQPKHAKPGLAVFELEGGEYHFQSKIDNETMKTTHQSLAGIAAILVASQSTASAADVPQSPIIKKLSYSETFTVNTDTRAEAAIPPGGALEIENSYGNSTLAWPVNWSLATNDSVSAGMTEFPGDSGRGSATGMTQTGLPETATASDVGWGLDIPLKERFAVQFDAVIPTDRIGLILGPGAKNGNILAPGSISVFIRPMGDLPEVGVFDGTEETSDGLQSGLGPEAVNTWHTFGFIVDRQKNTVEVFVDGKSRGTTKVAGPIPAAGVGYSFRTSSDRVWSDNFLIGSP